MQNFTGPFHQSDIGHYLTCPHSFYLGSVLKQPEGYRHPATIAGSALHWVINCWHEKGQNPLSRDKAEKMLKHYWQETIKGNDPMTLAHNDGPPPPVNWEMGTETQEQLWQNASQCFFNYTNQEHNVTAHVLHSEISFAVPIYKNHFEGSIDQIRINPEGYLELWDFKFSKNTPSQQYLDRSNQFTIYGYAMKHGTFWLDGDKAPEIITIGEFPQKMVWYHLRHLIPYKRSYKEFKAGDLRGDPRMYTFRTEVQFKQALKDIRKICSLIKQNHFPRAPRETGSCAGFCRFHDACMNGLERMPLDFKRAANAELLSEFI